MTDYQTKQRRQNIIVGAFVIFAFGVFLWMLVRFRDLPLFVSKLKSFNVVVYFPEAPGVQKDTPVNYCGYQIGRVTKVMPPVLDGDTHRIQVALAIDKRHADIPEEVEIFVMKRGLGSSFVEVRPPTAEIEQSGANLRDAMVIATGQVGTASDFFPPEIQTKLEDLVSSITALSASANAILGDDENQMGIKKMIASFDDSITQAGETLKSIERLSDTGAEKMRILGDKFVLAAEQLEEALSESRQILAKIDSGEGTVGRLVNDGQLYEDLLESSQELRIVLEQIREWAAKTNEKGLKIKI